MEEYWEYLIEDVTDYNTKDKEGVMDERGRERWELVNVSPSMCTLIFKRRLAVQPKA